MNFNVLTLFFSLSDLFLFFLYITLEVLIIGVFTLFYSAKPDRSLENSSFRPLFTASSLPHVLEGVNNKAAISEGGNKHLSLTWERH